MGVGVGIKLSAQQEGSKLRSRVCAHIQAKVTYQMAKDLKKCIVLFREIKAGTKLTF